MKKFFKHIGIVVIILFAASIVFANIGRILIGERPSGYVNTLEDMIAQINSHLPKKGFMGFDYFIMEKVVLEENNLVWQVTLDTTFFYPSRDSFLPESLNGGILSSGDRNMIIDLDTLLTNDILQQTHHENLLYYILFVHKNKKNPINDEIEKRHLSQTWRIYSPFSDRQFEFTLTAEEREKVEKYCIEYPQKALKEFMSEYVRCKNIVLEIASNNADVQMKMTDEDSLLVFHCMFDKVYSQGVNKPIYNIRQQYVEMKDGLTEDVNSLPIFCDIKEICDITGKGFKIRYEDWNHTDSIDFRFF